VSYNMLKLSWHLLQWTGKSAYADFAHRIFWNGIMGTIDPSGMGRLLYYTPLQTGSQKNFGSPDNSFWCCYGTGVENWSGLGGYIYYQDTTTLPVSPSSAIYIHNFITSTLTISTGVALQQSTTFPDSNNTTFVFAIGGQGKFSSQVNILIPSWVVGMAQVWVNGKLLSITVTPGAWATVSSPMSTWMNKDTITVVLPMALYSVPMPDRASMVAIMYGPVVLVGLTTDNCLGIDVGQNPPTTWLRRTTPAGGPLRFQTFGTLVPPLRFLPLNEITDMVYTVYFDSCTPPLVAPKQSPVGEIPAFKGDCPRCKSKH